MYIGEFKGYPIYSADKYPKKYYAIVNGKRYTSATLDINNTMIRWAIISC